VGYNRSMKTLISLPDSVMVRKRLTVGRQYEILREVGNGVVVMADDGKDLIFVLTSRFE
jgi:hypothetical protein